MNKLYHQTFKLDNVYAVMIRIVNDLTRYQRLI